MSVIDKAAKKRLKRRWRRRQADAISSVAQADDTIERLLIRRIDRLVGVRRFVSLWLLLIIGLIAASYMQLRALSPDYQALVPIPGGLFSEGIIGNFSNANPLFASGAADSAVSSLVFSGLFKYDAQNKLAGDLASGYDLSSDQMHYIVHLRHGVTWQDGKPFTADDVVYTYKTIQDIEAQSPLYSSWQGISVAKQDDYTVTFSLPNALSSFPYSLTNGIVPQHLLAKVPATQLRSANFNTDPVGTGPFKWRYVEISGTDTATRSQRISLSANDKYWAGPPNLDGFSLITYSDDQHLIAAFEKKQLNAVAGLDNVPDELAHDKSVYVYRTPLTTAVMAFFNNSRAALADANVRKALVMSVDRSQLPGLLGRSAKLVDSPFLKGQIGYDPAKTEAAYNLAQANQLLDQAGWARDASGQRAKGGQRLTIGLSTQDTADYTKVAQFLQEQWSKVGVNVVPSFYSSDDIQASVIGSHNYDILLYGINVGVDPDEFAYWDSSQASLTSQGHLNLSEYKSTAADTALEAGRTRADPALRAIKYQSFLSSWVNDAPALALYQPNFIYITRGPVFHYQRAADNISTDRFYNVSEWEIRQQRQTTH